MDLARIFGGEGLADDRGIKLSKLIATLPLLKSIQSPERLSELKALFLSFARRKTLQEMKDLVQTISGGQKNIDAPPEKIGDNVKVTGNVVTINGEKAFTIYVSDGRVRRKFDEFLSSLRMSAVQEFKNAVKEKRVEAALEVLSVVPEYVIDKVTPEMYFEVIGKKNAEMHRQKGFDVVHRGRDRYIAKKREMKRDIYDMTAIRLSVQVLNCGSVRLVEEYLKKVIATKPAMSYLLYRFILGMQKAGIRCKANDDIITLLLNHGASFTIPVVKLHCIFSWAVLEKRWDVVRYSLRRIAEDEFVSANDYKRRSGEFDRNIGIVNGTFESLYDYALVDAPPDIAISMIEKGFGLDSISAETFPLLPRETMRAITELIETRIGLLRKKRIDNVAVEGRESSFQAGQARFELKRLEEKLDLLKRN